MRSACPVFVLGVLVSLQGVCALNFNPSDYQAAVGRQVTVTWTTSKGDPSTADLQLVLDNSIVAADVVDVGGFFHLFKIADTVQPGDGYAFKFVSTDGSAKLLAEIGTFSIASGGGAQTSPAQTTFHDPDFPTSPASSSGISTTRPFSSSSASPPLAGSSSPGQSSSSLVSTGAGTKSSTSIGPESSGAATSTRGTAHLSSSTITAIVVVAVLLPLIAGLGLWLWLLRRRRAAEDEPNAGSSRTPRVTPFRMLPSTYVTDDSETTPTALQGTETQLRTPWTASSSRFPWTDVEKGLPHDIRSSRGPEREVVALRERVLALERQLEVSNESGGQTFRGIGRESVSETPPPAYNDTR